MGRAGRWLRGLLGVGKKSPPPPQQPPPPSPEQLQKPTRRWGFGKSFREKRGPHPQPPPRQPPLAEEEEEEEDVQNKRAIAVAAATAAVAEAAVAAAHAAAAVVRLTSSGRRAGKREEWAAVKIQATFRAYLARRALRALRGLVKLQALVRGNIVRKQAAETMRCMQALVRVQARARACRALRTDRNHHSNGSQTHPSPPTPEKYEHVRLKSPSQNLKRNSSKATSAARGHDQAQAQSSGWNWLDRWMEERYWDLGEPPTKSGAAARSAPPMDDEKNAKILEVDTGKPQFNPRRKGSSRHHLCSATAVSDQNSRSFNTIMPDSPSKDSTVAQHSVRSPSSVDMQHPPSPLRFPIIDNGDYGESPHFFSASSSRPGSSRRGPFTPGKSECSRSLFSAYSDYPNYMANTESSRAKVRSQSAPKQRPELEKSGSGRRVSGNGLIQLSAGSSTTRRPSSLHSKFANKAYQGSGRLDRLGMPIRI